MPRKNKACTEIEVEGYCETIRKRLVNIIKNTDTSQKELSKLTGLSRPTISRVLMGQTQLTLPLIYKICKALDIDIDELFNEGDNIFDEEIYIYENAFSSLEGIYYYYTLSTSYIDTSSRVSEEKYISGRLYIEPNNDSYCIARLELPTKNFYGKLSILNDSVVVSLRNNENKGDFYTLLWQYQPIPSAELLCQIVLTTSTGKNRWSKTPLCSKGIITRKSLTQRDLVSLEKLLLLNDDIVLIDRDDMERSGLSTEVLDEVQAISQPHEVYILNRMQMMELSSKFKIDYEMMSQISNPYYATKKVSLSDFAQDEIFHYIKKNK